MFKKALPAILALGMFSVLLGGVSADAQQEAPNVAFIACKVDYATTIMVGPKMTQLEFDALVVSAANGAYADHASAIEAFTFKGYTLNHANTFDVRGTNNAQFTQRMFNQLLGRPATSAEVTYYSDYIVANGRYAAVDWLASFESPENVCNVARVTRGYTPRVWGGTNGNFIQG